MRFVALLIGVFLFSGCDGPIVKDTFMSLDKMKKTKKFAGYDIAIGPIALDALKSCEELESDFKNEDESISNDARYVIPADWNEKDELKFPGPMRITREVNAVIRMETTPTFHRRVKIGDSYYYFLLEEGVKGYGFKFVSVRNKDNDLAIIILKTSEEVPSWNDPKNRVGQGTDPFYKNPEQKRKEEEEKKKAAEENDSSDDN